MTKKNIKELRKLLKLISRQNDTLVRQLRKKYSKPVVVHNHFGKGCRAQVYNNKVTAPPIQQPAPKQHTTLQPTEQEDKQDDKLISPEALVAGIKRCQRLMWGNASYAVAFCVCRDKCGGDNATAFERLLEEQGISIPAGTVNAALHRNPWMRYPTDRWELYGAQRRVLKLRDELQVQIANP